MTDRQSRQFHFTGHGREYFRIWIVNVFLTILTLGIYSPWAKVRRNQYFYRHTAVAEAGFDYHGDPKAILKGRVLAVLLFACYSLVSSIDPIVGLLVFAVIMTVMPWLLVRSLRFRLHNSSYRGLRFAFHGTTAQAYINLLLWPLLSTLTLGLLWPLAQQRIARYIRNNSAYGDATFRFEASPGEYYRIYLVALLIVVLNVAIVLSIAFLLVEVDLIPAAAVGVIAGVGLYLGIFVFVYPYVMARMQNLLWNSSVLDGHRFVANIRASGLLTITLGNLLLIVLTLGLYKPFADIRLARYRIEHLNLLPGGSLDEFVAGLQSSADATGDEMADMFDFDIAL